MPAFLITIDVEGDNLWARNPRMTCENARFLPRFQALCERFGQRPTYLTNYEMATSPAYVDFARDVLARKTGEVGMHLHAWNSPPIEPLTADDNAHHPYLIDYPDAVMRDKIAFITGLLEDTFGVKMISHRAGRWAMDGRYARLLVEFGYRIDCSVTPHVSWRHLPGAPGGGGGSDYRDFPDRPYWMDLDDIGRPGDSPLLEVPMTIARNGGAWLDPLRQALGRSSLPGRVLHRAAPPVHWLRPIGRNRKAMIRLIETAALQGRPYVEFMLHSSEFMPGGSPTFPTAQSIERLYDDLEAVFSAAQGKFQGATLGEFTTDFARESGMKIAC